MGLSPQRPDPARAFRMLCRHNRFVQRFGRIRDLHAISRREEKWQKFIEDLEERFACVAGDLSPADFEAEVRRCLPELFDEVETDLPPPASHATG